MKQECRCNGEIEFKTVHRDGEPKEPGGHYFMQDFILHLVTPAGHVLDRIELNYCPICGSARDKDSAVDYFIRDGVGQLQPIRPLRGSLDSE